MKNFQSLGLSSEILTALDKIGFTEPTPVQEKSIPLLLQEEPVNFIGLAQTGTGKTAAFGLPLVDLIDANQSNIQALIMAPTRELGQQIAQQLVDFSKDIKALNVEVVYGGAAITNQIKALKRPTQILVATPGRLLDLIKRRAVRLDHVQYVVLDEADEMLNMGFQEDIDEILSNTPDKRVTWLFSATMPNEIRRIVKKYMHNPVEVSVNREEKTNKDITHAYVMTKTSNKLAALRRFLDLNPEMRGVMFCRTKRQTQEIADDLGEMGYGVEALHGDMSQGQRDTVMKRFKTRSMQLLVATDVAARGIDVNDLTHVIHHTLPDQQEAYTHRSGRTGRAGKKGISLAFINPRETRRIAEIEKRIGVKFEAMQVPGSEEIRASRIHRWASLISNTKVDPQAEDILRDVYEKFADLSKEEILMRLITTQLDHINQDETGADLNENVGGSNDRGKKAGYTRFFINLGEIDGLTKQDLVHFLCDIAQVKPDVFQDVRLLKNCGFFNLKDEFEKGFGQKFDGIMVDGREIRVNRDDQSPPKEKKSGDFRGGRKDFGSKPRRSRDGGGGGGRREGGGGGGRRDGGRRTGGAPAGRRSSSGSRYRS